jgi:AcrR family transcriptional regulator
MKHLETRRTKVKPRTGRGAGASLAGAGAKAQARGTGGAGPDTVPGLASDASARPSKRALRSAERRQAIVDAALVEFSANGFAAARLEDIAARAGVGKGTIYLYFKDKEELFQELIRTSIVPLVGRLGAPPSPDMSARTLFERFIEMFVRDVYESRRADIIRLIVAEGARFPALAEFYYREVVSRGIAGMQTLIQYGITRGEIVNPAVLKHPQLLIAPALVAVIWDGLFGKFAPLDVKAMLEVHVELIFGPRRPA